MIPWKDCAIREKLLTVGKPCDMIIAQQVEAIHFSPSGILSGKVKINSGVEWYFGVGRELAHSFSLCMSVWYGGMPSSGGYGRAFHPVIHPCGGHRIPSEAYGTEQYIGCGSGFKKVEVDKYQ